MFKFSLSGYNLKDMIRAKKTLHPKNRHQGFYDFESLIEAHPNLTPFVQRNHYGNLSIDFSNPQAVKALNTALLNHYYKIQWDLPEGFLCPPIPGRADYIHYLKDLLGPTDPNHQIRVLDIGVGANCIYPLIGYSEYKWHFVGTDINPQALSIAQTLVDQNRLNSVIELRIQPSPSAIFKHVIKETDPPFDLCLCNPPFHASFQEAQKEAKRKQHNLKIKIKTLNFGGQQSELWCPGGERAFIKQMIQESSSINCTWFTALVAKESHLKALYEILKQTGVSQYKTIPMGQGQKTSRILAWSFKE